MQTLLAQFAQLAPALQTLIGLVVLGLVAFAVDWLLKLVLVRLAAPFLDPRSKIADRAVARLAKVIPLLIVSRGIQLVPFVPTDLDVMIVAVARCCIVLAVAMAISKGLDYLDELYRRRPEARARPIKGYLQVLKIVVYCAAAILGIAVLIDQSPLLLLSGLGAMAAVLMLVFKDTILSLVASVQLSSNDMLRVGDWIEMPGMNADGDVIDIALHTVKVQNFDKTITTIPTHKLISDSFRNWRGMQESGGRRIKRSLQIDQNAIRFLSDEEVADLQRFRVLQPYLAAKNAEVEDWNARELSGDINPVNARRFTNIGMFRAYVTQWLKAFPALHDSMTLMVRQLPPTSEGLPLEIYCFTGTTNWAEYEAIQADIFDHLIAILPEFDLRLFQQPSGLDFATLASNTAAARRADAPQA
ncbi:mechanosensitive ion channel family protein [Aurantiacibacter xanthus]|uniref:Mechanosensing system component YbdG n=1 Tax=Aurantiacibacter xanthus TaxID=1784712 RepID=A0A3A1P8K5_9SPHN|nr:mechanosensitive ion channel domain-containing protein [Aurantiacibacter xanthus]RIV88439.1 mechanosensitive ion channel family protein [Aurantiacibacter xanthus]